MMFSIVHPEPGLRGSAVIFQHSKTLQYNTTPYAVFSNVHVYLRGRGYLIPSPPPQAQYGAIPFHAANPSLLPNLMYSWFLSKGRGETGTPPPEADTVLGSKLVNGIFKYTYMKKYLLLLLILIF